jgi:RimJ/RimL family protein N-acetyltransferase
VTAAPHTISTARLVLRPALSGDLDVLLAMRDAAAAPDPTRAERIRALLEANAVAFAAHGFGLWLVLGDGCAVGFVGLRPRESASEPELYYGLAPDARRLGFASEAARAVIDLLFTAPGVTGAWAVTDPPNLASCRVLERLGMRLEREGEFDGKPSRVYRLRRPRGPGPGATG